MILGIAIMVAAFYWLMYETEWLTARLPSGKPLAIILSIDEAIQVAVCAIIIMYAIKYVDGIIQKPQLEETNAHTS